MENGGGDCVALRKNEFIAKLNPVSKIFLTFGGSTSSGLPSFKFFQTSGSLLRWRTLTAGLAQLSSRVVSEAACTINARLQGPASFGSWQTHPSDRHSVVADENSADKLRLDSFFDQDLFEVGQP